jgi:hypothetical protein
MMGELVGMQIRLLIKAFAAVWIRTNKGFLSGMNAHVSLEVEVQTKSL